MTKVINTEKFAKGIYTKSEIRYIKSQGWAFVLESMVPVGCKFKKQGWDRNANIIEITITSKEQMAAFEKAIEKRVKALRKKMPENLDAFYAGIDAQEAAAKKAQAKAEKMENEIDAMLQTDDMWGIYSTIKNLRTGDHVDGYTARWASENSIVCYEANDWDGYSRRCSYPMVRRSFTLNIRKGWHLFRIGGLLTFVKGDKIIREGMACEWIEQGKSIADIKTVKGFLVRGEHIEAKTMKEAKAINAEGRAMRLASLLSARKKAERRAEQKANGTLRITFQDSLNAGNCRPGTQEFKHKYEEAIGHEAKDISITDLRKYGKQFGVEYYAERTIEYALNN